MSISQNLDIKQSQSLVMTPQLREAISLLQMSNLELNGYLEKELSENPFLEKDERSTEQEASSEAETPVKESPSDTMDGDFNEAWEGGSGDREAGKTKPEIDYQSSSSFAGTGAGGNVRFDDPDYSLENRLKDEKSLREHLIEQLHLKTNNQRDRMVGAMIIDYLDDGGYLRFTSPELAEKIDASESRITPLLAIMRQFDPTGIFAYDLPDCLTLQLKDLNRFDPAMEKCLSNLDKLAEGDLKALSKICAVDQDDILDMINEIRALDPRPASQFDHSIAQTAIPDVFMQPLPKHVGGGWKVSLNQETLPRVLVNREYHAIISKDTKNKTDSKYITDQLQSASWLVRALDQRANTVLKVASEIIEQQDGFFLYGVEFLRPLTLRNIAEKIDMHESTVSRVTMNKYIGTPRGLFELKYFFDSGVSGSSGGEHAAEAVKARIKSMIDAEDPAKILSDQKLSELLQADDINIARRTVAKYREALHIPSSSMRRKQKRNKTF